MLIVKILNQNIIGTSLIGKTYLSVNVFTKFQNICFTTIKKISNFENRFFCSKNYYEATLVSSILDCLDK